MKKLLLLFVVLLTGCDSEINSKHITVAQTLCFDQEGVSYIEIDPIGSDLFICNDGSQFVVGYASRDGENVYYIEHNHKDLELNEAIDRIYQPNKWAKKDAAARESAVTKYKPRDNRPTEQVVDEIMHPTKTLVGDRGL